MFIVRSLTSGPWRTVDIVDVNGNKFADKYLIMAREHGNWNIDNRAVVVEPGLCVSFKDENDAIFFLAQNRAMTVAVEPNMYVAFELEADAKFFVEKALGEMLSKREADELLTRGTLDDETTNEMKDDEAMMKTKLDNKAFVPPVKKTASPKPAPKMAKSAKAKC